MDDHNFKVVVKLRDDLSETQRFFVLQEIKALQDKLKIITVDDVTYYKEPPIHGYDDFGAVTFFFSALKSMKTYFSRLEYYDLWEGSMRAAV